MINEFDLTKTEKIIYRLLLQGFNAKEISEKLVISLYTAKTHIHNILKKTETKSIHKLMAKELLIMKGQKNDKN